MRTVAGFLRPALDKTTCSSGHRRNPESLGGQGWNRNPRGTVDRTGETAWERCWGRPQIWERWRVWDGIQSVLFG